MLALTFITILPKEITFPSYIQRNQGLDRFCGLSKATKLQSGRTGIQTQNYLVAKLHHVTVNETKMRQLGKWFHNGNILI